MRAVQDLLVIKRLESNLGRNFITKIICCFDIISDVTIAISCVIHLIEINKNEVKEAVEKKELVRTSIAPVLSRM